MLRLLPLAVLLAAATVALTAGTGRANCCQPYIAGHAVALGNGQVQVYWTDGTPGAADSPQVAIRRDDGTEYRRTNTLPIPPGGNSTILTGQPTGTHHYTVTEVLLGDDAPALTSSWLFVTVT